MDFHDSPTEAVFRNEARSWLEENSEPLAHDSLDQVLEFNHDDEAAWVASCREWQAKKAAAGYGAIALPTTVGGRSGSLVEDLIFHQEESQRDVAVGAFGVTLGMVAPTLLEHGTPAQRSHVRHMVEGSDLWCQLFSEPSAGSDLASVQTFASQTRDGWRIK